MAYQVEWTEQALEDVQKIIEYLLLEWSFQIAVSFEETILQKIETLINEPLIGLASEHSIRSILITRQNRLYYKVTKDRIVLLNVFDIRRDPSKNKFV